MELNSLKENELLTGISILAVLRYTQQLELSKCVLIEPLLSYSQVLGSLKRANSKIKSIEDLIFSADTAPAENKSFYIREIREEDRADFTELMCEHKFIGGLLRDLVAKAEVPADVDYARDLWDTYTRFQERFGIDGACYAICSKTSHEMTGFIRIAEPDSSGPNMNFQFKQKLTVHRDMVDLIKEFLNWFHRKYEARAISVDVNSDLERKIFMELGFKKVTDEVMVILPL